MKLIRENLFLLVLIGIVLVGGGILIATVYSIGDDVAGRIAARESLSDRLSRNRSQGDLVNERIVAAEADRGRLIVEEANRAITLQARSNRNQTPYVVLQLTVDQGGQARLVPAFPYEANTYQLEGLTFRFIRLHPIETANRIRDLTPTQVPTEPEIDVEYRQLMQASGGLPVAEGGVAAPAPLPMGLAPGLGAGGAGVDVAALNRKKAYDYAVFEKALRGRIYVDDAVSSEVTFKPTENAADEATLWRKQYKLWIATDVVQSIKTANEEVFKALPDRDHNVLNAAVKRWVSLMVKDGYSNKGEAAAVGVPGGGGFEGQPTAPPPGGMGGYGTAPPPEGMGGYPGGGYPGGGYPGGGYPGGGYPGGGYAGGGMPAPVPVAAPILATGETCTQHYTDTEKDVLQYGFQVVMPTRHIPLLMRKLTENRLHTVIGMRCDEVPKDPRFFYSNDPVMLVTFTCEAVFLTSWERDLMPAGFLRTLPKSAWRPQDKQRLGEP